MSEKDFEGMAKEAAEFIKKMAPGFTPKVALTLGSGCGDVANEIVPVCTVEYGKLPGFPVSSVQGHAGVLILGHLEGVPIVGLKGRVHYYEGDPRSMVVPVYTMKLLGAEHIFITNASGSLREEMGPGALVALTDHMNFSGVNPLIGRNADGMGPRFPSLYQAYDPKLRDCLMEVAKANNITLHKGVYVGTSGPSFETAAEINAYRIMGGDVVGMSTVGEVSLLHARARTHKRTLSLSLSQHSRCLHL
jgi:xanthosine phosphorylase